MSKAGMAIALYLAQVIAEQDLAGHYGSDDHDHAADHLDDAGHGSGEAPARADHPHPDAQLEQIDSSVHRYVPSALGHFNRGYNAAVGVGVRRRE